MMETSQPTKAEQIWEEAFNRPRDIRSDEYRSGVLSALRYRLKETQTIPMPFRAGTASADAFLAGVNEGHRLANSYLAQRN